MTLDPNPRADQRGESAPSRGARASEEGERLAALAAGSEQRLSARDVPHRLPRSPFRPTRIWLSSRREASRS